jgi:hypothetical protein
MERPWDAVVGKFLYLIKKNLTTLEFEPYHNPMNWQKIYKEKQYEKQ